MIMKLSLAVSAALAAFTPASAFIASVPGIAATPTAAASTWRQQLQQHRSLSLGGARGFAVGQGPLSMMSGAAAPVEQKGLVTVYHKDGCPYCEKVFALLEDELSLSVTRVNVLTGEDSEKKIKQMKTFSGASTVPQVFFNSEHLGGNDDVQKLHQEGKLEALIAKVRAEPPGMMKDTWYHPWY